MSISESTQRSMPPPRSSIARALGLTSVSDTRVALGLTLLCALTRLSAVPASLWEWDDMLFAHAMHRYDLAAHNPHPPGFPVFVMMARGAYAMLRDEHSALVAVNLIFASMLGAALFYFYREVFEDRVIALAGALLGIFAPNVWVHSGAARSDGPALTLGIIGLALVIRGLRSRGALLWGCAIFGLGMGVRVTLLPVMAPTLAFVLLAQLRRRQWRLIVAAVSIIAICILCWYVPLVLHTTWRVYRWVINKHAQFTFANDTFFSPTENAVVSYRLRRFFMDIWGASWIMLTIYGSAALGVLALTLRRRWHTLGWMAVAFLPFMTFILLINTPLSAPLYSLPYIPFFTGLAACGIVMAPRLIFHTRRWHTPENVGLILVAGLALGMACWSYPLTKLLRSEESPPVRASRYLMETLDPNRDVLYYDGLFRPHVEFYLSNFETLQRDQVVEGNLINPVAARPRIYGLTVNPVFGVDGQGFHWTPGRGTRRLRRLSLGRYFDAYVSDITDMQRVVFLSGWFQEESGGGQTWRWMSHRGKVALLGGAEAMTLRLRSVVASAAGDNDRPMIVLRLDGSEVDRFTAKGNEVDRTLVVKPAPGRLWSTLVIETDQTITPSRLGLIGDDRELGLQCFALGWSPAPGAAPTIPSADHFLSSGWYSLEQGKSNYWRWTSGQAVAHLPAIDGDALLSLTAEVPAQSDGTRSAVTIEVAGWVLDRIQPPAGFFTKTYVVPASLHRAGRTELVLSAGSVVSPLDQKPIAIQVFHLGWTPAEER